MSFDFLDVRPWERVYLHAKGFYLLPAAAMALLALRYALTRPGVAARLGDARSRLARRGLLGALILTAAFSTLVYAGFFNFVYGGFLNPYEFFHYYLGSKYAPEVGYFDIYNAAIVGDQENGPLIRVDTATVCDLRTYDYRPVREVLAEGERYKALFSEARWREWVKDVTYFKRKLGAPLFNELLRDKGYNGTPVWTALVGGALSRTISTDSGWGMTALALLDVALLLAAVACIGWAFGVWPALLTVILVSSSYLMAHVHMKGAFLRTDFVVALVIAMVSLAKKRHGLAGALLGYATVVRIFPAIFLFGPLVKLLRDLAPVARAALGALRARKGGLAAAAAAHVAVAALTLEALWLLIGDGMRAVVQERLAAWGVLFAVLLVPATAALMVITLTAWGARRKQLDPRHARFFAGFALVGLVLTGASLLQAGGIGPWVGFARKIAVHRQLYNHWNVGVASVVIAQFDPPGPRREALALRPEETRSWRGNVFFRSDAVHEKAGTIRLLQLLALAVSFATVLRLPDARAFAFGFVPAFFLTAPTYYYYIVLLLPFLYFASELDRVSGTLGAMYLFLFGALGFAFYFTWNQYFATTYWNSVLALGLTLGMTAAAFYDTPREATSPAPPRRPAGRPRRP